LFGPHLIIDGSKCDTVKLADRLVIERILTDYPRAIGMTRIGGPYMFEYQAPDPAYSGVSGLVVIAESHIAIHTFPNLDYFSMDIFSCKNFDHELAIDYIRESLGVQQMDRMLVQRGLSFRGPHHGPLGATDELIAAAAARHSSIEGITTGTIPVDDPLYPRQEPGKMIWPTYGMMPDVGSFGNETSEAVDGARGQALVAPANAAAAGDLAQPGFAPIHPMQLNPTASTSGVLDRLAHMGSIGRQLGKALDQWESLARNTKASVVLALGPHIVASGFRDIVADLMHRGHVSALILEGDSMLSDAYETLGYRHYIETDGDQDIPVRTDEEWRAALFNLSKIVREQGIVDAGMRPSTVIARQLGAALSECAPRPGILTVAAQKGIPVFTTGASGLCDLGIAAIDTVADSSALQNLLAQPEVSIIAFGTTEVTSLAVAATDASPRIIAIDAAPFSGISIPCNVEATLALPLLATGIVQRVPQRLRSAAESSPTLLVV
jgi:S-adenosylmethionine decarboxylase